MNYNFTGLNLAVVQRILSEVTQSRSDLARRKDVLEYDVSGDAAQTARDQSDLQMYTTRFNELTEVIASMPEGTERNRKLLEQSRVNARILTLQIRLSAGGGQTVAERQYSIATLDARIAEADEFILALQTRATELAA